MDIRNLIGKKIIFFDGGTGSLLQERGLVAGEVPELWNIDRPNDLIEIHKSYFEAGSNIVLTNTFGCNSIKMQGQKYSVSDMILAAVKNAKEARKQVNKDDCFIALDIGPTGKLLKPLGDLDFEDAFNSFKEMAIEGEKAGVDLIHIETMSDSYELKAAVLAAKETNLPVFATVVFDEKGKLLTGGNISSVVALLEGLGVDALGVNCGLGPIQMKDFVRQILQECSIPVIVKPNAGLPKSVNGKTIYDIEPEAFAQVMKEIAQMGACILGGCCGTTPEHIKFLYDKCSNILVKPIEFKEKTVVSSYAKSVEIKYPIIIGERINPTGKSRFKQALREKDFDYILQEALAQQENGADILDVNVGLPDIDETKMMISVIGEIQSIIDVPLQIDTSSPEVMEKALRMYNGKAMINSVNGKEEIMNLIFPLVKKYGGVVVGLTIDENGIPETAEGRLEVAQKIVNTAKKYGINKKDIVIDVLCMTISSDKFGAVTTLKALKLVKEKLGVKTILGVSNISFGLPQRENINCNFYTMALQNGLDAAIINPNSKRMMCSYYAYKALAGIDENCSDYISNYSGQTMVVSDKKETMSLSSAIEKGLKDIAYSIANESVKTQQPLDIINLQLIPALDKVGKGFEKGTLFLPQLLMSAEAAKAAFEALSVYMDKSGQAQQKKGKIILATVKGDIHDIGKNIVKVLLENYSYDVIDLGKDVLPQLIVETALKEKVTLVGLSALMTTTVPSMEETIKLLRKEKPDCKIMVGGAVLTQEYANMIGADNYSKDAMASVYYAQKVLG